MANTIKQVGIRQFDGSYLTKDIGVDYQNVDGLETEATAFHALSADKATTDKNDKDITEYIADVSKNANNIQLINGSGDTSNVDLGMIGATPTTDGDAGFVPAPTMSDNTKFLKGDGTWGTPQDTTYNNSANIEIDLNDSIDLTNTGVSAGEYGPTEDVTGSNGVTISIPNFTVDEKGRLTSAGAQTFTCVDTKYSAGAGLTLTGNILSLAAHASSNAGYGMGTASNYGHVKLSDTYTKSISGGNAAGGLAASQNALYNVYNTLSKQASHIGMIIHSTTLDSLAKVREIYGADTTWIQHTGYMLRGASSGVVANSAVYTAGEDTHTLTISEIPSHNHTMSHTHSIPSLSGSTSWVGDHVHQQYISSNDGNEAVRTDYDEDRMSSTYPQCSTGPAGAHSHSITTDPGTTGSSSITRTGSTGSGYAHNNLPKYKSVYIWERTA